MNESPRKRPRRNLQLLIRDALPEGACHLLATFVRTGRIEMAVRLIRLLDFKIPDLEAMVHVAFKENADDEVLLCRGDPYRLACAAINFVSNELDRDEFAAAANIEGMKLIVHGVPLSVAELSSTDYAAMISSVIVCLSCEISDDAMPISPLDGLWSPNEFPSELQAANKLADDLGLLRVLPTHAHLITFDGDRTTITVDTAGTVHGDGTNTVMLSASGLLPGGWTVSMRDRTGRMVRLMVDVCPTTHIPAKRENGGACNGTLASVVPFTL